MNKTQQQFITRLMPAARAVEAKYGIPASVTLAIAVNETGWGQYTSGNNYFGIKGTGPAGSIESPTWEVVDGQRVDIRDRFRAYGSPEQSFEDFAQLITTSPRYQGALQARTPYEFAETLRKGGYATDPAWGQKIGNIASGLGIESQAGPGGSGVDDEQKALEDALGLFGDEGGGGTQNARVQGGGAYRQAIETAQREMTEIQERFEKAQPRLARYNWAAEAAGVDGINLKKMRLELQEAQKRGDTAAAETFQTNIQYIESALNDPEVQELFRQTLADNARKTALQTQIDKLERDTAEAETRAGQVKDYEADRTWKSGEEKAQRTWQTGQNEETRGMQKYIADLNNAIQKGQLSLTQAQAAFSQAVQNRQLRNQRQQMAGTMLDAANQQILTGSQWAVKPGQKYFAGYEPGGPADVAAGLIGAKFNPPEVQPIAYSPRGDALDVLGGQYDLPDIQQTVFGTYGAGGGGPNFPPPPGGSTAYDDAMRNAQPFGAGGGYGGNDSGREVQGGDWPQPPGASIGLPDEMNLGPQGTGIGLPAEMNLGPQAPGQPITTAGKYGTGYPSLPATAIGIAKPAIDWAGQAIGNVLGGGSSSWPAASPTWPQPPGGGGWSPYVSQPEPEWPQPGEDPTRRRAPSTIGGGY